MRLAHIETCTYFQAMFLSEATVLAAGAPIVTATLGASILYVL